MMLKLRIEGLPKRTNSMNSLGWRARMAEARKWKRLVALAVAKSYFPGPAFKKANLKLVRHSSVEPDFDGLVSGFKHCIDGLIHAGVIVNDKMSVIGKPDYEWKKSKPGHGFIEIEVKGIA